MLKLSKAEFSVILLVFTLFLTVLSLFNQSQRASNDVTERAFASAKDLVTFVTTAQRHYIDMVSRVPVENMTASPTKEPSKVWLPVTFARSYIDDYSAANPGVDFRLYSRDPFSFNRDRVLDQFAENALDALLPGDVPTYRAVEEHEDGVRVVRLAAAFPMSENCVACHNLPKWGLQKQDWKVGEIRGIWEASIRVPPVNLISQGELLGLIIFVVIAFLLAVLVVWPAVRKEVRNRSFFHRKSLSMEKMAKAKEQEALTDTLTKIGNRRYFESVLDPMIENARQSERSLSAMMFDIDHFKSVNDTYGHDVGDQVIQSVADILRTTSRREDKIARLGGEEFVILVPDLDAREVRAMATRINSALQAVAFHANNLQFRVTMSGGIAHLQKKETGQQMLKRADALLYHAKNTGRDRICDHFDGQREENGAYG